MLFVVLFNKMFLCVCNCILAVLPGYMYMFQPV